MHRSVNFGRDFAGLSTVGYELLDEDDVVVVPRTTAGVTAKGDGSYGCDIVPPTGYVDGYVRWSTGADADAAIAVDDWLAVGSSGGGGSPVPGPDLRGPGSDQCTITLYKPNGDPLPNAAVWVTATPVRSNVVAGTLYSDSQGQVMFLLDGGVTYYLWAQKDEYESYNGVMFNAIPDEE